MPNGMLTLTGVVLEEKRRYTSLCLEVDVASEGHTAQEAKDALIEAVTLYLESAFENNLPYLRPVPTEENPLSKNKSKIVEIFTVKVSLALEVHA